MGVGAAVALGAVVGVKEGAGVALGVQAASVNIISVAISLISFMAALLLG